MNQYNLIVNLPDGSLATGAIVRSKGQAKVVYGPILMEWNRDPIVIEYKGVIVFEQIILLQSTYSDNPTEELPTIEVVITPAATLPPTILLCDRLGPNEVRLSWTGGAVDVYANSILLDTYTTSPQTVPIPSSTTTLCIENSGGRVCAQIGSLDYQLIGASAANIILPNGAAGIELSGSSLTINAPSGIVRYYRLDGDDLVLEQHEVFNLYALDDGIITTPIFWPTNTTTPKLHNLPAQMQIGAEVEFVAEPLGSLWSIIPSSGLEIRRVGFQNYIVKSIGASNSTETITIGTDYGLRLYEIEVVAASTYIPNIQSSVLAGGLQCLVSWTSYSESASYTLFAYDNLSWTPITTTGRENTIIDIANDVRMYRLDVVEDGVVVEEIEFVLNTTTPDFTGTLYQVRPVPGVRLATTPISLNLESYFTHLAHISVVPSATYTTSLIDFELTITPKEPIPNIGFVQLALTGEDGTSAALTIPIISGTISELNEASVNVAIAQNVQIKVPMANPADFGLNKAMQTAEGVIYSTNTRTISTHVYNIEDSLSTITIFGNIIPSVFYPANPNQLEHRRLGWLDSSTTADIITKPSTDYLRATDANKLYDLYQWTYPKEVYFASPIVFNGIWLNASLYPTDASLFNNERVRYRNGLMGPVITAVPSIDVLKTAVTIRPGLARITWKLFYQELELKTPVMVELKKNNIRIDVKSGMNSVEFLTTLGTYEVFIFGSKIAEFEGKRLLAEPKASVRKNTNGWEYKLELGSKVEDDLTWQSNLHSLSSESTIEVSSPDFFPTMNVEIRSDTEVQTVQISVKVLPAVVGATTGPVDIITGTFYEATRVPQFQGMVYTKPKIITYPPNDYTSGLYSIKVKGYLPYDVEGDFENYVNVSFLNYKGDKLGPVYKVTGDIEQLGVQITIIPINGRSPIVEEVKVNR